MLDCKPIPAVIPAAPRAVTNELTSIPIVERAERMNTKFRIRVITVLIKEWIEGSTPLAQSALTTSLPMNFEII